MIELLGSAVDLISTFSLCDLGELVNSLSFCHLENKDINTYLMGLL